MSITNVMQIICLKNEKCFLAKRSNADHQHNSVFEFHLFQTSCLLSKGLRPSRLLGQVICLMVIIIN